MTVSSVSKKFLRFFKVSYQGAVVSANSRTPRGSWLLGRSTPIPNRKKKPYVIAATKDFSACADVWMCLCYPCLMAEILLTTLPTERQSLVANLQHGSSSENCMTMQTENTA